MKKSIVSIIALLVINATSLFAHDLDIEVTFTYPAVISRSLYGADEPVRNATISVFSPSDSENPYQTGSTDPAGYFTIIPDVGGNWIIETDDGYGHLEKIKVTVSDEFLNAKMPEEEIQVEENQTVPTTETEYSKPQIPALFKIMFGISLIFGLTGFFYGYTARKVNKK